MLKLSNLKGGDLNKIEQALNLLKNLKINDGGSELLFKSFNNSNSSMTFVNQKGGEVKLDLLNNMTGGNNGLYSETSDAGFIRGSDIGLLSETSDNGSIRGGDNGSIRGGDNGSIRGGDNGSIRGSDNGLYSETSVIGSMRGGANIFNSETSLNSVGINNASMLSETSLNSVDINNGYSATSMDGDGDNNHNYNLQNLFIKASGGGVKDSNNTLSLSSITELKERNNSNMSVLRNKGLLGGGAKGASNNKLRTYDINSSSTNSICE